MPIKIDFTPIQALGDLAQQAGAAETRQRLDEAAASHDNAMTLMEHQAEIQAQAQYREQQFRAAMDNEHFQQGRITLQEAMKYNIETEHQKAEIMRQEELMNFQRDSARTSAFNTQVDEQLRLGTISQEEANKFKTAASYQLATGKDMPSGIGSSAYGKPSFEQATTLQAYEEKVGRPLTSQETAKVLQSTKSSGAGRIAQSMATQYNALSKDFRTTRDFYVRMLAVSKDPSAAGDLAIIFSFMKILDPTSVVREGEQANAQNAASVPERWRNEYNRVLSGQRLSASRQDFLNQAKNMYEAAKEINNQTIEDTKARARAAGIDENLIFGPNAGGSLANSKSFSVGQYQVEVED